jgi:hypothetical protein
MSIVLGAAVLTGNAVTITPPEGGFGGVTAVRLSNYTGDALIVTNINSESPGQEYLLPFQQNVYHIENVRTPPKVVAQVLGSGFPTQSLLVEWSNDPLQDFPGTYPASITQAPINPANTQDGVVVMAANANGQIPASTSRLSTTFFNTGPGVVFWSTKSTTVLGAATSAQLPVGAGVTLDGGAVVFMLADASGASVSWFG